MTDEEFFELIDLVGIDEACRILVVTAYMEAIATENKLIKYIN